MYKPHHQKYLPCPTVTLPDRTWPSKTITQAPMWCSVDLRDGNQALPEPMGVDRKTRLFCELVAIGFKEIEVGFPSASQPDFDFLRKLIDEKLIPADVTIQVLTQAREHLIRRTLEAIAGSRRAVVHIYNSTSTLQRRVVYKLDRPGIIDIATKGTRVVADLVKTLPHTEVALEYSPESFTGTELEFAREICEAVMDVWQPTETDRIILNLPATVEMSTPNVYADQIEWFHRNIKWRDRVILSVHPHNDRGTAVAAAELALMAGADRVEGTLFGNGERTGNVDVVTLALNMLTQGVDPKLRMDNIDALVRLVEHCNQIPVHPRHPYAGELVYTAFSGSHQDAIRKGFAAASEDAAEHWAVPYLPIDPADVGRNYEAVIRINSQSGKGGVGYILESDFGLRLPRSMLVEFSRIVQTMTEATKGEVGPKAILTAFEKEYLLHTRDAFTLRSYHLGPQSAGSPSVWELTLEHHGQIHTLEVTGTGPIDAFARGLNNLFGFGLRVTDYAEHTLGAGADATAMAYIEVACEHGRGWGAAKHSDASRAPLEALLGALSRVCAKANVAHVQVVGQNSAAV